MIFLYILLAILLAPVLIYLGKLIYLLVGAFIVGMIEK
jgi:hypothetical protein